MNEKNVDPRIIEEILNRIENQEGSSTDSVSNSGNEDEALRQVISTMRHSWNPPNLRMPSTADMIGMIKEEPVEVPSAEKSGLRTITWQWILLVFLATVSALAVHFMRPLVLSRISELYHEFGPMIIVAMGFALLAVLSSPVIVLFSQPVALTRSYRS
jgi:hypothetical protein